MISANTFFKEISYTEIVAALVNVMSANFKEFAAEHTCFKETIASLEGQLEGRVSSPVSEVVEAIYQQIGSRLVFSFFLGLKANLDHYYAPFSRTFVDVDPEIYLRENVAHQLPDYQNAQRVQKEFYATLTTVQQEMYDDISSYVSYLETVGPKLAHYYGYVLGNRIFPCVIPGYAADTHLTLRYQYMLDNYLGIDVDCDSKVDS